MTFLQPEPVRSAIYRSIGIYREKEKGDFYMKYYTPEEFDPKVFTAIGKDWMLVSAFDGGRTDKTIGTLTASWGGMGVLWGKNVFFCFVRPQRFTKEFIDRSDKISLSFFDPSKYRAALNYCGTHSGRGEDKIRNANLHAAVRDGAVYFDEARLTIVGRKLFAQPLNEASFLDSAIVDKFYPAKDFHTMYVCEISEIFEKTE